MYFEHVIIRLLVIIKQLEKIHNIPSKWTVLLEN